LILGLLGQRSRSQRSLFVNNVIMVSAHYLENCLSQSVHFYMLIPIGLGEDMTLLILSSLGQRVRLPIPIHKITSSHFYSMNLFKNRLPVLINHPSIKTPFRQKEPGGICVVRHYLLSNIYVTPNQKSTVYSTFI